MGRSVGKYSDIGAGGEIFLYSSFTGKGCFASPQCLTGLTGITLSGCYRPRGFGDWEIRERQQGGRFSGVMRRHTQAPYIHIAYGRHLVAVQQTDAQRRATVFCCLTLRREKRSHYIARLTTDELAPRFGSPGVALGQHE